ncbi:C4b-binding protein alpha chain-like isoform 2-T2 [Liasis olivaceus]
MLFPACQSRLPPWAWLLLPALFVLPEAQGNCTSPEPPLYSSLSGGPLKESYPVGTVLTYHCILGYEYIPGTEPSITCLNTSKWSEVPVFCQGKKCRPPVIENGKGDTDGDVRLGGSVTFSCVHGFRLIGEATVNCILKNGRVDWNRDFPSCQHIPCPRPDTIPNGYFDPHLNDEYYTGSAVIYRCDRDFSLIGNSTITCIVEENGVNGKWNLPAPECKKVKCDRPEVENGKLSNLPKPSYTYNEGISFECNSGYSAMGSLHIKCGANSSWVPAIPKCVKVISSTVQAFSTSQVTTPTTLHSEDKSTVTREATHKPNTTFGHDVGNCTSPEPPLYSSLSGGPLKESYPVGTVLTYHCILGYEYIPGTEPSITCLNTSKWSEVPVFCQGKKCRPPVIENGKGDTDGDVRLGGSVTFSCVHGFRLIGEATVNCVLKNGRVDWNRDFPSCQHIPCPRPDTIPNGYFDPHLNDEYYTGSAVIYRCDRDFSLIGNSTITCIVEENGVNGKWNLPAPECKKVKCDRPEVENGKLSNLPKPSYTYNEGISFECNSGYSAMGSLHIKCGANSSWVPAIPKCVKVISSTVQAFSTSRVTTPTTLHSEDKSTVTRETTQMSNTTSKGYTGYNKTTILGKLIILLALLYSCW